MAQYKVPQDVEADDKLLGPFSFRQFIYLLIAGALIALGVGLFQLFPLLTIIPLPPVVLFVALALPLRKDQPMETYLAAIISYYMKPHTRFWIPGQKESVITITAPKVVEESRVRNITSEEATHRLSFLADIVDTEGYAIKGSGSNPMKEELVAEANAATDMFEDYHYDNLNNVIEKDENARHEEVIREMRDAIDNTENVTMSDVKIKQRFEELKPSESVVQANDNIRQEGVIASPVVVLPNSPITEKPVEKSDKIEQKPSPMPPKSSIIELANNDVFSVATIAEQAKRINRKDESEVFISLH